ncbi:MAG: GxxExxY protein [Gemmatimonadaceae bacterium]
MASSGKILFEETTKEIIGSFYAVYNKLGYGFLESVYQRAMMVELTKRGVPCASEVWLPVFYDGVRVGHFRADIIVDGKVIVETKSIAALRAKHDFQIINYLKASDLQVGLVLNFGPDPNYQRFVQTNRQVV